MSLRHQTFLIHYTPACKQMYNRIYKSVHVGRAATIAGGNPSTRAVIRFLD